MPTKCWSKTVEFSKPTHAALIKLAVFLEDVGLTQGGTGAHSPADGHRDLGRAVGYRVEAFSALAFDPIRVFVMGRCEEQVIDENAGLLDGFERAPHISGGLRTPLCMTPVTSRRGLLAGLRPDEREQQTAPEVPIRHGSAESSRKQDHGSQLLYRRNAD
jgi:hypothetical protein